MTTEHPSTAPEPRITHDFDAFRATQVPVANRPHTRILGQVVPIPTGDDLPASLMFADVDLANPDPKFIADVLTAAYGEGRRDAMLEKGMKISDLMVVVTWTLAQANGEDISFPEVAERLAAETARVLAAQAAKEQAATQRDAALGQAAPHYADPAAAAHAAAVEEAGKALSSCTGPSSKPIYDASTAYAPQSSQVWAPGSSVSSFGV